MALLKPPSAYMATAEATSDCELLAWDHILLHKLVSRHPLLMENGLHIGLDYLRSYVQRHVALVTKTAEQRLAETLTRLSHQSGEVRPHGVEIQATNDQLGALADISPFTASRVLTEWARAGILSKKRGRVVLPPPALYWRFRLCLLWRKDKTRLRLVFSNLPSPGGLWFDALRRFGLRLARRDPTCC